MLAPALAVAIGIAYGASLWWLLRRESGAAIVGIVALSGLALVVRIWQTNDFPAGLIEDEPKMLRCAGEAFAGGNVYKGECVGIPMLFLTVFEAQLVPLLGPTRWAIRSFSLITSVLAVPAAYAVGRSLALRVGPSLVISALVACLPWSIFFGRIALGGELVFHELLLLAALARMVFAVSSWVAIGVGAIGLCGLLYDYFCGRAMVPMTIVAAVLARGRFRLFAMAVLVLAVIGWLPYLRSNAPSAAVGFTMQGSRAGMDSDPLGTLWHSTYNTLRGLVPPAYSRDSWFTIRWASVHPWLLLAVAALGSLTGVRRGLFLWAAFLGGLAPSIMSEGQFPSGHRMLMAFPVIAIAVGCAIDVVPTRRLRVAAAIIVAAVASGWGMWSYFSPQFWPVESLWVFSTDRTDIVEALPAPPHPRLIVMKQLGYYFGPRTLIDHAYEALSVDNWVPQDGAASIYAFDPLGAPLRPFYEQLVGDGRIKAYGQAFTVSFEAGQWSWIRRHGWAYEAHCGSAVQRALVPVLFFARIGFDKLYCTERITHTWHGRWQAAATQLRLYVNGEGTVETSRGILTKRDGEWVSIDFAVEPQDEIWVTLVTEPPDSSAQVSLREVTPGTERLPLWESVDPIIDGGAATAARPVSPGDR
jgi:hypothetical protein